MNVSIVLIQTLTTSAIRQVDDNIYIQHILLIL